MTLCIALSYGSRQEIVGAVRKIAALAKRGDISPEEIDEKMFSDMLYTKGIPDPDLVVRTSGEQRDFDREELEKIVKNFQTRERRYGKA